MDGQILDRRGRRGCPSINDAALALISLRCPNLTRLKLRGCREISDLEELSVKRLRGIKNGVVAEPIGPGIAGSSLRSVTIKEFYNGQCFSPLVIGSKNLKTLKIIWCLDDWDKLLEAVAGRKNCLMEVHLERLQVSDVGLMAVSKCPELENFHLVKAPDCSNDGISAIAENCKLLRKLHIDGWRTNRIGDEGLIAVAKNSVNLVELVLIEVNPSAVSLKAMASNCQNLERLALCGSETIGDAEILCVAETIGDAEILCVAEKCKALKKLCIKGCHITDSGIEAFAVCCPNLVRWMDLA